ncbi:manganese efflux pump MntP [Zavarzinia sp. CC-PAN008]|uniref:manganese efflux pump MntP n=1 Tax=Zavarzinia sp. CC-PAN008 TaxID=3243332 RepID=UPI003F74491D
MNSLALAGLALSMSADAFAASVAKGSALHRPRASEALRTGLLFGVVEAITPLLGWAAGYVAAGYVEAVDHWIAFVLLAIVGGHMIRAGLSRDAVEERPSRHTLRVLLLTAIGTSIDAAAVGVSLALLDVNILVAAGAIGLATFVMVTIGTLTGRFLGARFGKSVELVGGVFLILLGAKILLEHTLWA